MKVVEVLPPGFLRRADDRDKPPSVSTKCVWECHGCGGERTAAVSRVVAGLETLADLGMPQWVLCRGCSYAMKQSSERVVDVPSLAAGFVRNLTRPPFGVMWTGAGSTDECQWQCQACDDLFVTQAQNASAAIRARAETPAAPLGMLCSPCANAAQPTESVADSPYADTFVANLDRPFLNVSTTSVGSTALCRWLCEGCGETKDATALAVRQRYARWTAAGAPIGVLCLSCGNAANSETTASSVLHLARRFVKNLDRPGFGAEMTAATSQDLCLWWCPSCALERQSVPAALRDGCKGCAGQAATPIFNMSTLEPALATQFIRCIDDPSLSTYDLLPKSGLLCEWECPEGHRFDETPHQRMQMSGADHCPVCSPTGRRSHERENIAEHHPGLAVRFVRCVDKPERTAATLTRRSGLVCEWRCDECGTEDIGAPINQADECPVCNGYVIGPDTCLKALFPDVAAEFLKNIDAPGKGPDVIGPSSSYLCLWQAACGHEPWSAPPHNRTKIGTGCPKCSPNASRVEVMLWHEVSAFVDLLPHGHQLNLTTNDRPVVPDIVIPAYMLIVEYDGEAWHGDESLSPRDVDELRRTQYAADGWRTVRIRSGRLTADHPDDLSIPKPYKADHPGKFVADLLLPHLEELLGVELVSSCGMSVGEYVACDVPLRGEEAAADLAPSRARSQEELAERDAAALTALGWGRGRVAGWYASDGSATRLGVELGGWGASRVLRLLRWWNIPRNRGGSRG